MNTTVSKKTETFIEKSFSVFMALYPLLCLYKGFSNFTIGDLLLIVFFIIAFIRRPSVTMDSRAIIICSFVAYAVIGLAINIVAFKSNGLYGAIPLVIRLIKFSFYMACALLSGMKMLNNKIFKNTLLICATISCFFLFFQYALFYSSGTIILGRIPGLTLFLEEYAELDYESIFANFFRPSSFFLEPSLFVHYVIVALTVALFDKGNRSSISNIALISILVLGILMSTSAQGVLFIVIVFTLYIFKGIKNKGNAILLAVILIGIALICYLTMDVLRTSIDRLLNNVDAADARLGSYRYCLEMNWLRGLFGYGYGSTAEGSYMPGAAYVWYGCGLIGLIAIIVAFLVMYKKADNNISKVLCALFFVMFFGTALFYNYMVFWYFYLIMAQLNANNEVAIESNDITPCASE